MGIKRTLDPTSPTPLYDQLRSVLLDRIASGEFGPGDRLPTEMQLCDEYGVSRTTASQALNTLSSEGVVVRARRRGSIVDPAWRPSAVEDEIHLVISDLYRADEIRASLPPRLNVRIDVVDYDDIRRHLLHAIAIGKAPDIAMIDHVWVAEFAGGCMIHALDDLDRGWSTEMLQTTIHPAVAGGYTHETSLYAVPEEVNLAGVWYNTERLRAHGIDVPTTWDELLTAARILKEADATRFPIAFPGGDAARETTTYCVAGLLASNGAGMVGETVDLDSSEAVVALRLLRTLVEEGLSDPNVISADWLAAPRALGSGAADIAFGGSYETEHIARAMPAGQIPDGRMLFTPFPAGPSGSAATVIGGMGYAIFRQSDDPHRALDIVKAITRPDNLDARSIRHGTISPTGADVSLGASHQPYIGEVSDLLELATTRPKVSEYAPVTRQIQRMVRDVISGSLRPAAAVERTADFISAITELPLRR